MAESLAFREWAKAENLVYTVPIKEFKPALIGYDAEDFVNILLSTEGREPLLPALGGLPFTLRTHIDRELENLKEYTRWPPVFVFNGIDLALHDRKTISKESERAVRILDEAWRVYDQGDGDAAVRAFEKACTYRTTHILRYLYHYLHDKGVHVRVAPYTAAAQLVYMDDNKAISACHGSASLLAFRVDKMILNFDWENKTATYIDRERALQHLMMTQDQLIDLLLLSGSSGIMPPVPEIVREGQVPSIAAARQVLHQAGMQGFRAAVQQGNEYRDMFFKARTAIKHMVVCTPAGEYIQLNFEKAPNDLALIIGTRYPIELYHYLQRGVIGPRVLDWRARKEIFISAPLDGGNSTTCKELVQKKLQPLYLRTLTLLSSRLQRYFHNTNIDMVCWFDEKPILLDIKSLSQAQSQIDSLHKDAETWHVRDQLRAQSSAARQIDLNETPIQYAITWLTDTALAKKSHTKRGKEDHSIISTPAELLSNITWRFLHDRGYINTSDHTLTAWGKALMAAFDQAKEEGCLGATDTSREAEEAIFIAFELLRLDLLNGKDLFPGVTGGALRGSEQEKAHVQLITRVATLGTFKHQSIGYTGPLSRNTLAYHQVAAAVRNALRDLVEVHAVNLMLSGSAVRIRNNDEYTELGGRLPFLREPDLGLALVVKSYLDELCRPAEQRTDVKKWFSHAEDIEGDMGKAWKLWSAINAGIQAADGAIVNQGVRDTFESANTWLQERRATAVAATPVAQMNGNGLE